MLNESLLDDVEVDEVEDEVEVEDEYTKEHINVTIRLTSYLHPTFKVKKFLEVCVERRIIFKFNMDKVYINPYLMDVWFYKDNFTLELFSLFFAKLFDIINSKHYIEIEIIKFGNNKIDNPLRMGRHTQSYPPHVQLNQLYYSNIETYKEMFPRCSMDEVYKSIVNVERYIKSEKCIDKQNGIYKIVVERNDSNNRYDKFVVVSRDAGFLYEMDVTDYNVSPVYHCGLLKVYISGKYNYIDVDGNLLSGKPFNKASDFDDVTRTAIVNIPQEGFFSYDILIDAKGKMLTKEKYEKINKFCNGYSIVINYYDNDKFNFIDINGDLLLKDRWLLECSDFESNGYAYIKDEKGCGIIDKSGNVTYMSSKYSEISYYGEDFWMVRRTSDGLENYIDSDGNELLDEWHEQCNPFCNGFGIVEKNKMKTYVDKNGEFLCKDNDGNPLWFNNCSYFDSEGNAMVIGNDWKFLRFINTSGAFITKWYNNKYAVFDVFDSPFVNGFAPVFKNTDDGDESCNFVGRDGKLVSGEWFESIVSSFNEYGTAVIVKKDGKWTLIDKNGNDLFMKNKIRRNITKIYSFKNGYARVRDLRDKENIIRVDGSLVSKEWYSEVEDVCGKVFCVSNGRYKSQFNFMDINGNLIFGEWLNGISYHHIDKNNSVVIYDDDNKNNNVITPNGKLLIDGWVSESFDITDIEGVYRLEFRNIYIDSDRNLVTFI